MNSVRNENAILICANDSVVTVMEPILAGAAVIYPGAPTPITAHTAIPIYHKIAIVDCPRGAKLYKYGQCIGYATQTIMVGDYVHTHNLDSMPPQEVLG